MSTTETLLELKTYKSKLYGFFDEYNDKIVNIIRSFNKEGKEQMDLNTLLLYCETILSKYIKIFGKCRSSAYSTLNTNTIVWIMIIDSEMEDFRDNKDSDSNMKAFITYLQRRFTENPYVRNLELDGIDYFPVDYLMRLFERNQLKFE